MTLKRFTVLVYSVLTSNEINYFLNIKRRHQMEHNISILFYSKISKKAKDNQVPIYLRITVNGKRIEQSTHRFVQRSQWSSVAGRMKGTFAHAKVLNDFLDALRNKVHATERAMVLDGIEI